MNADGVRPPKSPDRPDLTPDVFSVQLVRLPPGHCYELDGAFPGQLCGGHRVSLLVAVVRARLYRLRPIGCRLRQKRLPYAPRLTATTAPAQNTSNSCDTSG